VEAGKPAFQPNDPTTPSLREPGMPSDLFQGPGGLRSGWRLLIYLFLVMVLSYGVTFAFREFPGPARDTRSGMRMLLEESAWFAVAFGAAMLMSRLERRPVGEYGLPAPGAFGHNFWLGFLFGLAEISVLIGLISMLGGYSFGELTLRGPALIHWGLLYLVTFVFVGLFEEFLFRGYTQFTLGNGIGFWPAAILLSLAFGGVHILNPGEDWVGAASVVLVGLFFAFTLWRTGNLWYAVGLHASFDWGETYLYSVPNSGYVAPGHLSNAILHGPTWLTGGTVGPEGSVFCFLTIGLQFLVVTWLFPKKTAGAALGSQPNPTN
jgi:uncharacterized protein